jgi:hypothetical protein
VIKALSTGGINLIALLGSDRSVITEWHPIGYRKIIDCYQSLTVAYSLIGKTPYFGFGILGSNPSGPASSL